MATARNSDGASVSAGISGRARSQAERRTILNGTLASRRDRPSSSRSAARTRRVSTRRAGGSWRWRDGEAAAIGLDRERAPLAVRPDAWFVLRLGRAVLVGLVEVDRGTERGDRRWGEKLDAYAALFAGGRLPAVTGYVNARVLVLTPDARRRDALTGLLAERAQETGAAAGVGRFWLAERSVLEGAELTAPAWRRPGCDGLCPLVTDETLAQAAL